MENLITVISFTLPHHAHFAKGKLQSEGVEVFLKDEMTAQVHNFYSNAIGGVKLQVRESDVAIAHHILVQWGYIKEQTNKPNKGLIMFDNLTCQWPIIGPLPIEFRIVVLAAIVISSLVLSIAYLSLQ